MEKINRSKHHIEGGQIKEIDMSRLNIFVRIWTQTTPKEHGRIMVVHPVCISPSYGLKECCHKDYKQTEYKNTFRIGEKTMNCINYSFHTNCFLIFDGISLHEVL